MLDKCFTTESPTQPSHSTAMPLSRLANGMFTGFSPCKNVQNLLHGSRQCKGNKSRKRGNGEITKETIEERQGGVEEKMREQRRKEEKGKK